MRITDLELVTGPAAEARLQDPAFLAQWRALLEQCRYATGFQSPSFVRTWYAAYRDQWQPVILYSAAPDGALAGLWLLAYDPAARTLAHAGAHQAEYHAWLARPEVTAEFLSLAWTALKQRFAFEQLLFKYLPAVELGPVLWAAAAMRDCVSLQPRPRPLLKLDPAEVQASLAKKRYRTRLSRLKKMGRFEFRRLTDPVELERIFDEMIDFCDFRQKAVYHVTPFRDDPHKRPFHAAMVAEGIAYVTVTYLDDHPIAAFWGTDSGAMVHMGILIYSPFLAEYSPARLHILQLSEYMLGEGKLVLDLTPGGALWKEHFANTHDEVADVVVYRTAAARARADALRALRRQAKHYASRVGLTPDQASAALAAVRRLRPAALASTLKAWLKPRPEVCIYRGERDQLAAAQPADVVRGNSLADLLAFEPEAAEATRVAFLANALTRLENEERVYTIRAGQQLAQCGWVSAPTEITLPSRKQTLPLPPGSAYLHDFYTPSHSTLSPALLSHMVYTALQDEAVQHIYLTVAAADSATRAMVEALGLVYQG